MSVRPAATQLNNDLARRAPDGLPAYESSAIATLRVQLGVPSGGNMDKYWVEFIEEYQKTPRFQYFPHAHVGTGVFPKMVAVLADFEGREWDQDAVMKALRDARLTSGDGAGGRMIRKAAENLGLFWFDNKILWLTPAGRAIANGEPSKPIFERLLWRYQLSNPVNDGAVGFNIYPHHALVEILSNVNDRVSRDEFILFVGRTRSKDEIPATIEQIRGWRKLKLIQQDEIINQLGHEFTTRKTDASYAIGFHASAGYLDRYTDERRRKGIKFGGTGRGRAMNLLATNKGSPLSSSLRMVTASHFMATLSRPLTRPPI